MLLRLAFGPALIAALLVHPRDGASQDLLRYVDLNSPEMSTSEMTRAEVDALLKAVPQGPRTNAQRIWKESGCRTSISPASTSPAATFAWQSSTGPV